MNRPYRVQGRKWIPGCHGGGLNVLGMFLLEAMLCKGAGS